MKLGCHIFSINANWFFPLDFLGSASIAVCEGKGAMKQSFKELQAEWEKQFKQPPPPRARREFLSAHLRWHAQAKHHGGLSRKTKSQLKKLTEQLRTGVELTPNTDLTLKLGTKLLREYKGRKFEVIVCEEGYRYNGRYYKSLSKIAREITGTQWNGKLFFGVKK